MKRKRPGIELQRARATLRRKAGTLEGAYYAVGVEVPPKYGATFRRKYTVVASARAGLKLLREKLLRKKVGMTGQLIVAIPNTSHEVELAAAVREKHNKVWTVYPSTTVGHVRKHEDRSDRAEMAKRRGKPVDWNDAKRAAGVR